MKIAVLIARTLLGLIFFVFGINFFFNFMHLAQPPLGPKATAFSGGLFGSDYFFQVLKSIEITSGFFLLINRFTPFFLLVLLPISVNIFLFHLILAPSGVPLGTGVLVLELFLCIAYRKYYQNVFTANPKI